MGSATLDLGITALVTFNIFRVAHVDVGFQTYWELSAQLAYPAIVFSGCSSTTPSHVRTHTFGGIKDIEVTAGSNFGPNIYEAQFAPYTWPVTTSCYFNDHHGGSRSFSKYRIVLTLDSSLDDAGLIRVQFAVALAFRRNMRADLRDKLFVISGEIIDPSSISKSILLLDSVASVDTTTATHATQTKSTTPTLYILFVSDEAYFNAASSAVMSQVRQSAYFESVESVKFEGGSNNNEKKRRTIAAAVVCGTVGGVAGVCFAVWRMKVQRKRRQEEGIKAMKTAVIEDSEKKIVSAIPV